MRRNLVGVLAAAALASAGVASAINPPQPPVPPTGPTTTSPLPPPTLGTGLAGFVRRGPLTPVCKLSEPCYGPAQVLLRFWRGGNLRAETATRRSGAYRVSLAPGVYTVSIRGRVVRLSPPLVRVPRRGFDRVDFTIETGIR